MVELQIRNKMYEQFIEYTNQIFGEGHAEQLAKEDPQRFRLEYMDFIGHLQD